MDEMRYTTQTLIGHEDIMIKTLSAEAGTCMGVLSASAKVHVRASPLPYVQQRRVDRIKFKEVEMKNIEWLRLASNSGYLSP